MKTLLILTGLALALAAAAQAQNPPLHHGFLTTNEVYFIGGTNINATTRNSGPSNTITIDYTGTGTAGSPGPKGDPGTNTTVTVVVTNYFTAQGQVWLTNQTSLLLDYSQSQTWQILSTDTSTGSVSFMLTNLLVPEINLLIRNLAASNLNFTVSQVTNWVWQVDTNAPTPTNCYSGTVKWIKFLTVTNGGTIGAVNP